MKELNQQKGFSLIEILIGLGIFAIIFISTSYLLLHNLQASFDNQEKTKADFLVTEGLEATKAIASHDWSQMQPGTYGLELQSNHWQLVSQPETISNLAKNGQRTITITNVDGEQIKKIVSTVNWLGVADQAKESSAATLLTNWHNYVSVCSDGLDNDHDGFIDFPADPGCDSPSDDDEINEIPVCIPGPTEICDNAIDDNCDGLIDCQDPICANAANCQPQPICTDNDQDGFNFAATGCGQADCNDNNATINPNATEICTNGLDDNCNDLIDCQDPACSNALNCQPQPSCTDNDHDGFNVSATGCGQADCDDTNIAINPNAGEICTYGIDDNCNGLIDCADSSCASAPVCQPVVPNVIFDQQDQSICKLDQGTITVSGKVILPDNQTARLQLSYYTVWPADERTSITYVDKGVVSNNSTFSLNVPWPGVRINEKQVEIHIGAMLLNVQNGNPLMTSGASLDYYWYPWVCPAPPTVGECLDADQDGYYSPGSSCNHTVTVQSSGNIKAPKGLLNLKVIASQITYGENGPKVSVKAGIKINGTLTWLFDSQPVEGGEEYDTTLPANNTSVAVRGYAWYQNVFTKQRDSDSSSPLVRTLLKGDSLPNVPRFGSQNTLSELIDPFVDQNRKIDIDVNQALLLFELGGDDPNATSADFQDLVILFTFIPDISSNCQCGPFDCDDTNPYINSGAVEIPDNGVDENCDFISG